MAKPKPLGAPFLPDEDELAALIAVTDGDIDAAIALWLRYMPDNIKALLFARQQDPLQDDRDALGVLVFGAAAIALRYLWQPMASKTGRYLDARTGRLLSPLRVRQEVDRYIGKSYGTVDTLANQLRNREISIADWQAAMRTEIKALHLDTGMVAHGGRAQMTQADWERLSQQLRYQYGKLDGFANEIATGKWPLNGRLNSRAKLYSDAARGTYEQENRRNAATKGATEEQRVRNSKESCAGCIQYGGYWAPIGTLPPIGSQDCVTKCLCAFIYR